MAILADTFATTDAAGNREDLADIIYDISPEDTPFMSNGGRGKAEAVKFEWQTDELDAPDGANAQDEGNEAVLEAITPTVRLDNYVQISTKVFSVTRTQEMVKKAGRRSEAARALTRKMAALKRDMETILTQNQAKDAGEPRLTGSILSWITTNTSIGGGAGANPAGDGSDTRTDGTQRAFLEDHLKDVLSQVWTEGGKPEIVMVGAFNKQQASVFTGIAQIRKAVEGAKRATIVGAADVYVSDFGNVTFVPNRFSRARDALVLDTDMYSVAYLDSFKTSDLAKTGDTAAKKLITVEYGLKVHNEKALGGIFDLTTS